MSEARRPLILIANDDGVRSPGLAAAAAAARPLGDLLIVAPRRQQTTMGRAFPIGRGVGRIERTTLVVEGRPVPAYAVAGSPAQAVAHGVLELADRRPALCVSGINYGENVGPSLTCSGTLGAAFEAFSHGVPAIAVSLQTPLRLMRTSAFPALDWSIAMRVARRLAERVLRQGLPPETAVINVNVPDGAAEDCRVRLTRQSRMSASMFAAPGRRALGVPFRLRVVDNPAIDQAEPDSDVRALLLDRMISVTPLGWDMSANAAWSDSSLTGEGEAFADRPARPEGGRIRQPTLRA